ncbi:MAG: hypothetical protein A3B91_03870 [Candidatus Yanofskybacteria bacterium RIFCSPHIGHO2_02_FULL_41_29]|uniref:Uncharacterized protein n=1 Tax=Candidatus Yanofskybacteria bacterium RIFCSPHIGHO2_01_FULL_41_53 TaxID=1802663 RepID=A0A1F8EFM4_9BACT|nr:MAG: hypothetical protein A2650_02655 [Candidatus Yanofskybacteria bacterium RIFCSPHIGHO2_01_FULL_41_53]OGN10890.1 MAG: hypothetical protein A3B91_03870 [Candidatus Yanofskybacteria bacterium RIFCSPHIGHO2_02_FULL_41_29]OGN19311.1 MAG: hypothetical protein A3F48_01380 [Candidatus Yanofskybacteria bacterium RIFCSPHIGHO2_12_FULL_41_9]OGN21759.1 MAG: hypothetical protein A2916_03340 [Candidatus Yanofskybacteria bacterium RIFCSPLOWO2_01_FULL_41_67]OGN29559.1 MAG: hypothetical protein A3H54_01510 
MDEQITSQQNISLSGISGGGEIDIYTYFTASPYFAGFDSYESPERKIFLSSFRSLSPSLREFLSSDTTASTIFTTGQSYNLDDNQIFTLAKSVRELLTGKIFIKDFPITLSSKLGIDDIKAGEIADKLISKSFGPIIEDLKRIQRNKFPDRISQMQKETVPEKLTQPTARPVTSREAPTPAQALQETSDKKQTISAEPRQPFASSFRPPPSPPPDLKAKSSFQTKPEPVKAPAQNVFKIPDLGQSVSPESKDKDKKSINDELEKIANVIDLRSQEK